MRVVRSRQQYSRRAASILRLQRGSAVGVARLRRRPRIATASIAARWKHEEWERIVVAAEPLQEIDNTAFTAPRAYRRAAVAAPDGGTCVDRPIHSRRNARAARLASLCVAVLQSMRQLLGGRHSIQDVMRRLHARRLPEALASVATSASAVLQEIQRKSARNCCVTPQRWRGFAAARYSDR